MGKRPPPPLTRSLRQEPKGAGSRDIPSPSGGRLGWGSVLPPPLASFLRRQAPDKLPVHRLKAGIQGPGPFALSLSKGPSGRALPPLDSAQPPSVHPNQPLLPSRAPPQLLAVSALHAEQPQRLLRDRVFLQRGPRPVEGQRRRRQPPSRLRLPHARANGSTTFTARSDARSAPMSPAAPPAVEAVSRHREPRADRRNAALRHERRRPRRQPLVPRAVQQRRHALQPPRRVVGGPHTKQLPLFLATTGRATTGATACPQARRPATTTRSPPAASTPAQPAGPPGARPAASAPTPAAAAPPRAAASPRCCPRTQARPSDRGRAHQRGPPRCPRRAVERSSRTFVKKRASPSRSSVRASRDGAVGSAASGSGLGGGALDAPVRPASVERAPPWAPAARRPA